MKKLNRKGFVLMETLIVSVFVMALFTVLYTDLFPLLGEYHRRENYDDIDSKYAAHWVRKMVLEKGTPALKEWPSKDPTSSMVDITSCASAYVMDSSYCLALKEKFHITRMYLTEFDLRRLKQEVNTWKSNLQERDREFVSYLDYLPTYPDPSKKSYYRVIVEIDHDSYKTYGTIEVIHS